MKSFRRLLLLLLVPLALLGLIALAIFTSPLQTSLTRRFLSRQPELQYALGKVSAGLDHVTITDLRLRRGAAILRLPSVEAGLPVAAALRNHEYHFRSLVAKGWTLDLANYPARSLYAPRPAGPFDPHAPDPLPESAVLQAVFGAAGALLADQELPFDLTLAAVELEGDVVLPAGSDLEPLRVQVKITGGGLAADASGTFTFEASTTLNDARAYVESATVKGTCTLSLASPRQLHPAAFTLESAVRGRRIGPERDLTATLAGTNSAAGPELAISLDRNDRHLAEIRGTPAATGVAGTWKADLRTADLAPFFPTADLPDFLAEGDGTFGLDAAGTRLELTGTLRSRCGELGLFDLAPFKLGQFGADTRFALVRTARALRIEQLETEASGAGLDATVRASQPFTLSSSPREPAVAVAEPAADWLAIDLRALSTARLPAFLPEGLTARADTIAGALALRFTEDGGFVLRSVSDLTTHDAAVLAAGRPILDDLSATTSLRAQYDGEAWELEFKPLALARAGNPLASLTLTAKAESETDPVQLNAQWTLTPATLAPLLPAAIQDLLAGETSGEFMASLGVPVVIEAKAVVQDPGKAETLDLGAHIERYASGMADFRIPVAFATGKEHTDLSIDGSVRQREEDRSYCSLQLTGKKAYLAHLARLVRAVPALAAALRPGTTPASPAAPDSAWAGYTGELRLDLQEFRTGATTLKDARGTFKLDPTTLTLEGGQARLPTERTAELNGTITYSPGAESPYQLQAVTSVDLVNTANLMPVADRDTPPIFEGCFALTDTLTGAAAKLEDLPAHLRGEMKLTSTTVGIVRLLKTSIADAYTQKDVRVNDALVKTGTTVTSLFGVKSDKLDSGQKSVAKNTAAAFELSYALAKIEYDKAALTVVHEPDGSFRLTDLTLSSDLIHLTGTGSFASATGFAFYEHPLQLTLRLAARGHLAELINTAGLAAPSCADEGFTALAPPIELEGSLFEIDTSRWHDVLVGAATAPEKK